jgi:hypothetical protein
MREARQLVPKAVLFARVIAYKCTACGKNFPMPLLSGAVPSDLPAPVAVHEPFLRHVCEEKPE